MMQGEEVRVALPAALGGGGGVGGFDGSGSGGGGSVGGAGMRTRRRRRASSSSRSHEDEADFSLRTAPRRSRRGTSSSGGIATEIMNGATDYSLRSTLEELRRGDAGVTQEAATLAAALARHAHPGLRPAAAAGLPATTTATTTTTTTKTWTVGLDPAERRLHILLPGLQETRLSARLRSEGLATTPIAEVKKMLVQHHLIRYGAGVSDDDARRFQLAVHKVGRITNTALGTQWHNATTATSAAAATATPLL